MKEKTENYEPVDLCSCYEPVFKLPDDLIEEWRKMWQEKYGVEPEPTPENKAFYGIEPDASKPAGYSLTIWRISAVKPQEFVLKQESINIGNRAKKM